MWAMHHNLLITIRWVTHTGRVWILFLSVVVGLAVRAHGQPAEKPVLSKGEVTDNNVYVRSGPSINHYPVSKLMAGDRVTIIGDIGDWYEIQPPEGVISLISGDYVDTADDKHGVVNGNNVRVRAGSTVPDFSKLKYVVQTKLSKGAEVTILGREPDGFLRIKPPSGVSVWINRAYVELVPPERSTTSPPVGASAAGSTDVNVLPSVPVKQGERPGGASVDAAEGTKRFEGRKAERMAGPKLRAANLQPLPEARASALAALPPSKERSELLEIDRAARVELTKPVEERQFDHLIERYRVIAQQQEDVFAQRYAQARVEQLNRMRNLIETIRELRILSDETESKRRVFLEERAGIREALPPIPRGLDVQGELRVSAVYPPGHAPSRYRLVDTSGPAERTVAYVEIPQGSGIDIGEFLGSYVGVRASARRMQTGGVNPVPIYVAEELIRLQPERQGGDTRADDSPQ